MRALLALLAWFATSCAAHNAHRIPIDMNADLAPLIDEAWARMEEAWPEPVPRGDVPVDVAVEEVDVEWLPFSPELPPGGAVVRQAELVGYIEEALRPKVAPAAPSAQQRVRVQLLTDLSEPDALQIQVECGLLDPAGRERVRGRSIIVRFARLYCHGCRDRMYGKGTRLATPEGIPGDRYDPGVGFFFFPCWPGSSAGYHKD